MLAKPLRDGWAVNKKWHDMILAAGTNQTACQSLLTFSKTPERCRSLRCCWRRRLSLSYSVCLHIHLKSASTSSPISPILTVICFDSLLSVKASIVFARCFPTIFGINSLFFFFHYSSHSKQKVHCNDVFFFWFSFHHSPLSYGVCCCAC